MKIKPGVSLKRLDSRALIGISIAASIFERKLARFGYHESVVYLTSGWRDPAKYDRFSLHQFGLAGDLDATLTAPSTPWHREAPASTAPVGSEFPKRFWDELKREVREALPGFDVLAHGPSMHLHIEYDPRSDPDWLKEKEDYRRQWWAARKKYLDPEQG